MASGAGFGVRSGRADAVGPAPDLPPPVVPDWPPSTEPVRRPWMLPAAIVVVLGSVAAIVALIAAGSDGDLLSSAPTTTEPRVEQPRMLSEYCDLPGEAWPEVPAYVAGDPIRTQVRFLGGGVDNALDRRSGSGGIGVEPSTLGTTAISPANDGRFASASAGSTDVRTVTCVTHVAVVPVFESCFYETDPTSVRSGWRSYDLSRNRYRVAVFELHTGDIVHEGMIETEAAACPRYMSTSSYTREIAWGLQPDDVLAWFDERFVEGKPT